MKRLFNHHNPYIGKPIKSGTEYHQKVLLKFNNPSYDGQDLCKWEEGTKLCPGLKGTARVFLQRHMVLWQNKQGMTDKCEQNDRFGAVWGRRL